MKLAAGAWQRLEALPDPRAKPALADESEESPLHRDREEKPAGARPDQALPWRQLPAGSLARDTGHGRIETRTLKAVHVSRPDFPCARQAIKICR